MNKTMKKIDKTDMKNLIQMIKQFQKDTKDDETIASSSKISTKDLLFFFLAKYSELETRTTKIESSQKFMCWFIGIAIPVIALFIGILR